MSKVYIPEGYKGASNKGEVHLAISLLKSYFQAILSRELNLIDVYPPLFVEKETGINDGLNSVERAVSFSPPSIGKDLEIVHSLAKWKRVTLFDYKITPGHGIVTNMRAIRQDEELSNIHSLLVDQWDWEQVLPEGRRDIDYLQTIVRRIYYCIHTTEKYASQVLLGIEPILPEEITFLTTQELEDLYPELTPKERENHICKERGAVFLMQVGKTLKSGKRHDGRAFDYDDWELNGDILVWYPILEQALELSSMGIRVDAESLISQAKELTDTINSGRQPILEYPYHQGILKNELPLTIGGGIGQSRLIMFLLRKVHIGEVQVSVWDQETLRLCKEKGLSLL